MPQPFRSAGLALSLALVLAGTAAAAPPAAPGAAKPKREAMVVQGDDHLFLVSAPEGWVLDDTSGMGSRIRCVFYPKGQTWASAPTVMYVNPLHGYAAKQRTVSMLMAEDQRNFLRRTPGGKVRDAGTLKTGGSKVAQLRYFANKDAEPTEAVAYVPERDLVMLLVLSSKTSAGFARALPAFRDMVSTYAWVGANQEFGR